MTRLLENFASVRKAVAAREVVIVVFNSVVRVVREDGFFLVLTLSYVQTNPFKNRENQDHHQDKNGRMRPRSPFEKLKNLDMVRAWPLDYMHLVRNFNAFLRVSIIIHFDFRFA